MVLNKWECGEPGCTSAAVGVGGAVGLRAIGWWFETGRKPRCPGHRKDGTLNRSSKVLCEQEGPCGDCSAEYEADRLQYLLIRHLELPGDHRYAKERVEAWKEPA